MLTVLVVDKCRECREILF